MQILAEVSKPLAESANTEQVIDRANKLMALDALDDAADDRSPHHNYLIFGSNQPPVWTNSYNHLDPFVPAENCGRCGGSAS